MAVVQSKESHFKLENVLSSGDYTKNEVQTKVNTRRSMESKIAGEGDGKVNTLKSDKEEDTADVESAYDDSFCSDNSDDDDSELTGASHRSSVSEIPSLQLTNSKTLLKKKDSTNLNKKFVSTSKIWDDPMLTLEDKAKSLSLNEVRPHRSVQFRPNRKNMSFTNDQIMKIERDNEILLRKIMAQQKSQKQKVQPSQSKLSSSAINRKKLQRKIEEDNMMLLRRLQQAKSCALNTNKIPGFRTTHL